MAGRGEAGLPRVLPIAAVVATAAVASLDCWRHCFGLEARWRRAINDKLLADAKVYEIKVVESHRRWQNHWPALDQRRSRAVRDYACHAATTATELPYPGAAGGTPGVVEAQHADDEADAVRHQRERLVRRGIGA